MSAREDTDALIALRKERVEAMRAQTDLPLRDAHPKTTAVVAAKFEVLEDLPLFLQRGIFATKTRPNGPPKYLAWLRFSNQDDTLRPKPDGNPRDPASWLPRDSAPDIRGLAIKVYLGPSEVQDFLVITPPVFVTRDLHEFRQLIAARQSRWRTLALAFFFATHPRVVRNLLGSLLQQETPWQRYHSVTPYALGPRLVVRYRITPNRVPPLASLPLDRDHLGEMLRRGLVRDFADGKHKQAAARPGSPPLVLAPCAVLDFQVQVRHQRTPEIIDHVGRPWTEAEAPIYTLARIKIPPQECRTEERLALHERLTFNPWNGLPSHQPLGEMNLARKAIYDALATARGAPLSPPAAPVIS